MAFVNCEDAKLIELRPVQPADFRQTDEPDEFLGLHKAREKVTKDEFRANKALLYQSYDLLFPVFRCESYRPVAGSETVSPNF